MDVYSQVQCRLCEPWDEVLMDERGWLISHWGPQVKMVPQTLKLVSSKTMA
jgi:hypothetical protein